MGSEMCIRDRVKTFNLGKVFISQLFENILRSDAILNWVNSIGTVSCQNLLNFLQADTVPIDNSLMFEAIDESIFRSVVLEVKESQLHIYFHEVSKRLHDLHHFLVINDFKRFLDMSFHQPEELLETLFEVGFGFGVVVNIPIIHFVDKIVNSLDQGLPNIML